MLGLDLQQRHLALTSESDGLACDAAACAIRAGQYDMALELLEERSRGRNLLSKLVRCCRR
jgi:hypothetical protein